VRGLQRLLAEAADRRDAFPHPHTEASAAEFLEMVDRQNPTTFFAIATQEEAVGGIGISLNQDVHRLPAEMGYWLGEPYWGRGLMTEAVAKFTPYALKAFSLCESMPSRMSATQARAGCWRRPGSCWRAGYAEVQLRMAIYWINFCMHGPGHELVPQRVSFGIKFFDRI
jgi:hypothetical protein